MYINIYIFKNVYIYIYIYLKINIYIYIYIYIYFSTIYIIYIYIYMYICMCIYIYMLYIYIYIYICVCVCVRVCVCTYILFVSKKIFFIYFFKTQKQQLRDVFKIFTKSRGKYLCPILFLNKVPGKIHRKISVLKALS